MQTNLVLEVLSGDERVLEKAERDETTVSSRDDRREQKRGRLTFNSVLQ